MNFDDTADEAVFRGAARAFLDAHAPRHLEAALRAAPQFSLEAPLEEACAWQRTKAAHGWACLEWPAALGGRGASAIESVIWAQEEGPFAKLALPFSIGIGMAGPTVMALGTDTQRSRYLPRIATGEEIWCQLFSEPGAGSDLAGVATRATRDGETWVVTGQKVWTSWAHASRFGLLLARTDLDAPKHKGLTMFVLDMNASGIDIRPIRQMNGKSVFNEVWLNDVRVPDADRIGAVGGGWRAALTTLMNERVSASKITTGFEELFALCQRRGLLADGAVRSRLATWGAIASGLRYSGYRTLTNLSRGAEPGPENAIGKLAAASTLQDITRFALDVLGMEGLALGGEDGWFQAMALRSPGLRIEAGSDEILRNVIAERVLGLPAEPRVDKDVPFRDVRR